MKNYRFVDISHWEGTVNIKELALLGHRLVVIKASDSYFMPDKNNKYDWVNHTDAYFKENYENTRDNGLLALAYHFVRYDRPLPMWDKEAIIRANLTYLMTALSTLRPDLKEEITTVCLDLEQNASQLKAAGLTKADVSAMTIKIVDLFFTEFDEIVVYSGSWWTNEWITDEAMKYIASKTTYIEAEYPDGMLNLNDRYSIEERFSEYIPTVPTGYWREFATTASDCRGRIFAHQYTSSGRIPNHKTGFDLNRTELPKEELYKFFKMDGAVDPPPPPPPPPDDHSDVADAVTRMKETIGGIEEDYGIK